MRRESFKGLSRGDMLKCRWHVLFLYCTQTTKPEKLQKKLGWLLCKYSVPL
jgi:hypothetical protein